MGLANRLTEPGARARAPRSRSRTSSPASRRPACARTACRPTSSGTLPFDAAMRQRARHAAGDARIGDALDQAVDRFVAGAGRHGVADAATF